MPLRAFLARALAGAMLAAASLALPAAAAPADLVIVQVAPYSGPLAPTGSHLGAGARAGFEAVNAAGGIHGARLRLVTRDDGYQSEKTVQLSREAIRAEAPIALFGAVGTGNVEALLRDKVLEEHGIVLATVRSGAGSVVHSGNPWLFVTRASYAEEVNKIVRQYQTIGYTRFAAFYQKDPFGEDGLAAIEAAVKAGGGQLVARGAYEKNTVKVEDAVRAIAAAAPQAVLMVSNTAASAEFLRQSRAAGNLAQYVALSTTDAGQVVQKIGAEAAQGLAISQVVPDPGDRSAAIVRDIQEHHRKYAPKEIALNHTFVEGYLGARVLVEALRRAGPNPSRRKLREALEGLRDFDAGGFHVGFGAGSRSGARYVDVTILNKEGRLLR